MATEEGAPKRITARILFVDGGSGLGEEALRTIARRVKPDQAGTLTHGIAASGIPAFRLGLELGQVGKVGVTLDLMAPEAGNLDADGLRALADVADGIVFLATLDPTDFEAAVQLADSLDRAVEARREQGAPVPSVYLYRVGRAAVELPEDVVDASINPLARPRFTFHQGDEKPILMALKEIAKGVVRLHRGTGSRPKVATAVTSPFRGGGLEKGGEGAISIPQHPSLVRSPRPPTPVQRSPSARLQSFPVEVMEEVAVGEAVEEMPHPPPTPSGRILPFSKAGARGSTATTDALESERDRSGEKKDSAPPPFLPAATSSSLSAAGAPLSGARKVAPEDLSSHQESLASSEIQMVAEGEEEVPSMDLSGYFEPGEEDDRPVPWGGASPMASGVGLSWRLEPEPPTEPLEWDPGEFDATLEATARDLLGASFPEEDVLFPVFAEEEGEDVSIATDAKEEILVDLSVMDTTEGEAMAWMAGDPDDDDDEDEDEDPGEEGEVVDDDQTSSFGVAGIPLAERSSPPGVVRDPAVVVRGEAGPRVVHVGVAQAVSASAIEVPVGIRLADGSTQSLVIRVDVRNVPTPLPEE